MFMAVHSQAIGYGKSAKIYRRPLHGKQTEEGERGLKRKLACRESVVGRERSRWMERLRPLLRWQLGEDEIDGGRRARRRGGHDQEEGGCLEGFLLFILFICFCLIFI